MSAVGFLLVGIGLVLLVVALVAKVFSRLGDDLDDGTERRDEGTGDGAPDETEAAGPGARLRGHDGAWVMIAAVPLLVGGLLLADLRRIPDLVGLVLLAGTLVALLAVWAETGVRGVRARRATASAVTSGSALVLAVGAGVVLVTVLDADVASVLIAWGFAFVLVGVLAMLVGIVWSIVTLIRRQGRARAGRFVLASVTVIVVGLVGVVIVAPRSPPVPESIADAAALDDYLQDLVGSNSPPSVSVVVVADGATVYERAFGTRNGINGLAATPETVYHWYSTTKIVTAIATLQLVERGLVGLDDPVQQYLDFFDPQYPSETSDPVTIADLLNHSAGLPNNVPAVIGWLRHDGDPALDQTEFLRERLPSYDDLGFEPGSQGIYTNVGYYTLAAVIEQVTGVRYEDYVIDNILDPLGMDDTRFEYTDPMVDHEAVGAHPMADFLTVFIPLMDPPWPNSYIRDHDAGWVWFERFLFEGNAPTGLIGPAPDKARLVATVLDGGELDGERVLSEEGIDTMLSDYHVVGGSSPEMDEYGPYDDAVHGLGWFVVSDGARTFHDHSGGGPGFASYMRLYADEGLGIVILANGTNLSYLELADAIADIEW